MATTKKTDRTAEVAQSLSALAHQRILMKAELEDMTNRLKEFDQTLIEAMRSADVSKVESPLGNVTLVQATVTSYEPTVLKEVLTTAQWKRIIDEVVNRNKLEAEILVGRIDSDLVEAAKSTKQNKPYLR